MLSSNLRFALILNAMLLTQPALAEWTKIESIDREVVGEFAGNFTVYVDYSSIRKVSNGQTRIMWYLWDFDYPQKLWGGRVYKSEKLLDEYDCELKKFRTMGSVYYSEKMAEGQIVDKSSRRDNPWGNNWSEAMTGEYGKGTPVFNTLKAACEYPLPK